MVRIKQKQFGETGSIEWQAVLCALYINCSKMYITKTLRKTEFKHVLQKHKCAILSQR